MGNRVCEKKVVFVLWILILLCGMTVGCSKKMDKNGSMKAEDGRSYGGHIQADMGETVNTAFFDLSVKEAVKYDTYQFEDGLYQADSGSVYLVVEVTIENTYEKDLPMSITDFTLDFEGNTSEGVLAGYGRTDLNQEEFMDNIFTLKTGESITKSILFTVENKEQYTLNYTEYYEDEFKGDDFSIELKPEQKSVAADTASEAGQEETLPEAEAGQEEILPEVEAGQEQGEMMSD